MARMIPATLSPETESRAEGRMFYALRDSLNNSYTVFHSVDQAEKHDAGCMIQDTRGRSYGYQSTDDGKGGEPANCSFDPAPCTISPEFNHEQHGVKRAKVTKTRLINSLHANHTFNNGRSATAKNDLIPAFLLP